MRADSNGVMQMLSMEMLKRMGEGMDDQDERIDIADKAKNIVYGDREKTYGAPSRNLEVIARMWSAYTESEINAVDVCNMMAMLKIARLKNNPGHEDSMVDLVGYALLHDRIVKGV